MKLLKREAVNPNYTWDLSDLFSSDSLFLKELDTIERDVSEFTDRFKGSLKDANTIQKALKEYEALNIKIVQLSTYASLNAAGDQSNQSAMELSGKFQVKMGKVLPLLNFLKQELNLVEENILQEVIKLDITLTKVINDLIKERPHQLNPQVEDAISQLSNTLNAPYEIYNHNKLIDMTFDPIEVEGKQIPLTFGYYEDELAYELDKETRHKAYDSFHKTLKQNENTHAAIYKAHVLKEKAMAELKGFDSTIEYLLFNQDVSADMYHRQIDIIMEELAPHMRKFAKHLQKIHNLETMTYKDLHLVVDPDFEPKITVEEAKDALLDGLSTLGPDYLEMVEKAFDERWIDFPQNIGKSTGAFCSSPYGVHPYVLISWTEKMREVFVLAHELGHAGHFYFAGKNQNYFNTRPSLYFIEAPSTMNELIMANHLKNKADNPRFKRWILSTIISRTYYHNFVTHLIEAAFQREVYRAVDKGQPISANFLNQTFRNVLETFWGEDVEISEHAELTWMRQPHYYMGLYPYTYSAGLTIATEVSQKIINEELDIERWKDVLKAGGTKSPLELAQMVDIDLSTDKPLKNTIKHIGEIIDEIISLTDEL